MPELNLGVERATVKYGAGSARVQALSDVSLHFKPGTLTLVMGPSGSGKTTLLSLLGCLLTPDEGAVLIQGRNVARLKSEEKTLLRRRHIGFVFQAFRLFHALSAYENVMVAASIAGSRDKSRQGTARRLLAELGLAEKTHLKPDELSGGEKQRVAIARALLSNPGILLADEPTASLDSRAGQRICEILRGLADEQRRTVVIVSHDPRWESFAHRTVVLQDGRVVKDTKGDS